MTITSRNTLVANSPAEQLVGFKAAPGNLLLIARRDAHMATRFGLRPISRGQMKFALKAKLDGLKGAWSLYSTASLSQESLDRLIDRCLSDGLAFEVWR